MKLVDLPAGRQARWTPTNMYTTYAISSLHRNYIYVGLTNNIVNRFNRHQQGQERTTKPYRPFKLIYSQEFKTRLEARKQEIYLKSGIGKEYLKKTQNNEHKN